MTRRYRPVREGGPLRCASPERLLLLTIFGNEQLRRHIDNELDRRAMTRHMSEGGLRTHGGGHRAA